MISTWSIHVSSLQVRTGIKYPCVAGKLQG